MTDKEDMIAKIKSLIATGNLEQAKQLLADNKDKLGDIVSSLESEVDKFQDSGIGKKLGNNVNHMIDGVQNLFKK